jgi:hypothetical protein
VLKKTGIVAAAIAASLLAVTPLAFAGGRDSEKSDSHSKKDHDNDKDDDNDKDKDKDKDKDHDKDKDKDKDKHHDKNKHKHHDKDKDKDTTVTTDNLTSNCTNGQTTGPIDSSVSGGNAGLLGVVNLAAGIVAPITAQAPLLNCNNIEVSDLVDLGSNNPVTNVDDTSINGSGNGSGNG